MIKSRPQIKGNSATSKRSHRCIKLEITLESTQRFHIIALEGILWEQRKKEVNKKQEVRWQLSRKQRNSCTYKVDILTWNVLLGSPVMLPQETDYASAIPNLAICEINLVLDQLCPTHGPLEGFVRPSLGFLCGVSCPHTDNLSWFW